jgi:hypothetical protein
MRVRVWPSECGGTPHVGRLGTRTAAAESEPEDRETGTLLWARVVSCRVGESGQRMPDGGSRLQRATTKPLVIRPNFVSMTIM